MVQTAGNGQSHWRTDYLGERAVAKDEPEAFLIEMTPGETILPHFHAVDQFQIFVEGVGTLGRSPVLPVMVHYADHHTAYGPIVASETGLSYFTFRPACDPGAVYRNFPDYRARLKPSRRRHSTVAVQLSTPPVLAARSGVRVDPLLENERYDDHVSASIIRMAPGTRTTGPHPRETGGQYYLVLNGAGSVAGRTCGRWGIVHVAPEEEPLELEAESEGAEVLLLAFAKTAPSLVMS